MRMLELHAHAKQVKRSSGRSSVAAAAYRSASRLYDERTGLTHDYSNKLGVEHTRIYTPDNVPQWAQDREALWNAAEVKENRQNSCTAHELEVSFPHEFNPMQRREAGDSIAREIMRRYGVAVDIAYHRPTGETDERNFHAHILFTTRAFDPTTKDGWAKGKFRDLSQDKVRDPDGNNTTRGKIEIASLREFTAQEMNRIAERENLPVRTEHLSFEARGIDREPTQKMGPHATQMDRADARQKITDKRSRIANENRDIGERNTARVAWHMKAVAIERAMAREKDQYRQWDTERRLELDAAHQLSRQDLDGRHGHQRSLLEDQMAEEYGAAKATIEAERQTVERRLAAKGLVKFVRNVLGRDRQDRDYQKSLTQTLADIATRETEMRGALAVRHEQERQALTERQETRKDRQSYLLDRAATFKEREWDDRTLKGKWDEKIRKVDMLPTDGQAKVLTKRGIDPNEHNRVSAAKLIDQIAEREGWKKKAPAPANDPPKRKSLAELMKDEPQPEPSDRLSLDDIKQRADLQDNEKTERSASQPFRTVSGNSDEQSTGQGQDRSDEGGRERSPPSGRDPT